MLKIVRSDLHRTATIRSSRISLIVSVALGTLIGSVNIDAWGLLAGMVAFGLAATMVAQHYQHRTAVLLYLTVPRRIAVLVGQLIAAMIVASGFVAVSGLTLLVKGAADRYLNLLTVVPLMAVFGAAGAAVARRPTWFFLGCAGWFVFVEGLVGRLQAPLPFTAFISAGSGDVGGLLLASGWAAVASVAAGVAVGRDLTSD
ncbi:hypothetical protein [Micromonospora yangpuensis]|uniref:ABC-2 family transporter protein n=1 Tax=Micromonospora yangpuensis TaxID=683228 RepID=A0A1C6UL15_9ACTN|nr:hypothetical protein [Micromonospora yangpuensis]GGM17332.1 hypothetical protein GCM10012279_39320 [Micromonospora yangpuensis]SCL54651.1 hypothetical protein GA0070617_2727 [Micromonospora yangpuensis]